MHPPRRCRSPHESCSLTTFSELGLAEPIVRALTDVKHVTPTPIQEQAIPQVLAGHDLIGIAQTGTGKTAAFALPILDHLVRRPHTIAPKSVRVLVLSPTRELSGQIVENFQKFGRHMRLSVELAIGGVPMGRQIRALHRGVDVLVATPGRLIDLMENHAVKLDAVEVLVLDEADQMLDMGFVHAIRAIVRKLPAKRHSLFFSATMPSAIAELANSMLHKPVTVSVTPAAKTADRVEQRVIMVEKQGKPALLAELLGTETIDRALVFTRTKHGADRVVNALAKYGHTAEAIHGNKSQNQRDRVLAAFRVGTVRTLVATDIAARGIDVTGVSHVFNFDLPNIPESYVHRIGRTARAGKEGIAISFCDGEERAYLRSIERLIRMQIPQSDRRGVPASVSVVQGFVPATEEDTERRHPRGGRPNGGRPNAGGRPPRAGRPEGGRGDGVRAEGEAGGNRGRGGERRDGRPQEKRAGEPRADGRTRDGRGHHEGRPEGREGRPHDARPAGRRDQRGSRPQGGAGGEGTDIGAVGFLRSGPARGGKPGSAFKGPR
ncbi:DEAD/DEAH box helicase [Aquabacter sediminis]|uniref:DEAD/DEAH box helicase n=1 Tax=Aquabacter sediminis TaxID=3029197 RepID=UPI003CCFF546